MIVIGLMSGTSVDGADAVAVELHGVSPDLQWRILAHESLDFPPDLQQEVFACFRPESSSVDRLCRLNFRLGEFFARLAMQAVRACGHADAIGCHGQTLWHIPPGTDDVPSTLQLGNPAVIAQRTGLTVVSDFRSRDMAVGGQGAPLVPYVDWLLLTSKDHSRAVQNIGGIGNVTYLPANSTPQQVIAFDTGPGNMLMDEAVRRLSDGQLNYDRDGAWALAGRVHQELLHSWMELPYFSMKPPKSTGRELFGAQMAQTILAKGGYGSKEDLLATLTAFTAHSIARAYRDFLPALPQEILLCGGGAKNPAILHFLRQELPGIPMGTTDQAGLPSQSKEAAAFAILAYETLHRRPGNLPSATGAKCPVILGSVTYGA